MNIDLTLNIGDIIIAAITFLAFLGAFFIGVKQNIINKKMLALQDAVDIYLRIGTQLANVDGETVEVPVIMIHNISMLPVTLSEYCFNGIIRKISPYRLPPAAQFPDAYYYINLPIRDFDYVSFSLTLKDSFKRTWLVKGFSELKNGAWGVSAEIPELKKPEKKL